MKDHCVVAEFENRDHATTALEVLAKRGYGDDQISVVAHRDHPQLKDLPLLEEDAGGVGSSTGAGAGALLGGGLTAPIAASTLIGPFMLAGPLVGLGLGAAVGGFLAGDERWGAEEDASRELRDRVEHGSVLLIIAGTEDEMDEVQNGLKTTKHVSLHRFAEPSSTQSS